MPPPTQDIRMTLAANVRALMEWAGLNPPGMAARVGVSYQTMRRMLRDGAQAESDTHPTLDNIEAVASSFGMQAWQLLIPGMRPEKDRRPVCVVSAKHRRLIQLSDEPDEEEVSPLTEEVAREIEQEHDNPATDEARSPTGKRRADPKVPAARKASSPKRKRVPHKQ